MNNSYLSSPKTSVLAGHFITTERPSIYIFCGLISHSDLVFVELRVFKNLDQINMFIYAQRYATSSLRAATFLSTEKCRFRL